MSRLYLIDPFLSCTEDGKPYETDGINRAIDAKKRLEMFSDRTVWLRMFSEFAARHINELLDFCYIDGNHEYKFVKRDLEQYFPLIKEDGIIGEHDYPTHSGVVSAVRDFSKENGLEIYHSFPDFWFIKK